MVSLLRKIIGGCLIIIIVITIVYSFIHRDEFLKITKYKHYSDGCNETYINGQLFGDMCTASIKLNYNNNLPVGNFSWTNLTIN